jgi:uncharacterized protein (DUF1697 family)
MQAPAHDTMRAMKAGRSVAFLRAINVGGHTVKMDELRRIFEAVGLKGVETFIASGNVIFETRSNNLRRLEKTLAVALKDALGFEVATFIRTSEELSRIAKYAAFPKAALASAAAFNVAFLASAPDAKAIPKLMSLKTAVDDFHLHGREVYWLCKSRQSDSKFSNAVLEKTLGQPSTMRSATTVTKMAARYGD